jgi:hypothetical protein
MAINNYDWAHRWNEKGTHTLATCVECGKGLNQDDAYGHDCEV